MEQYMTNERLKNTLSMNDNQARMGHTICLHSFRHARQYATPTFRGPQRTDTVPFAPQRLQSYMRKVVVDQNPQYTPPNAQKNPSAVPGDIPELNHKQ
jgi:hypothetical protein